MNYLYGIIACGILVVLVNVAMITISVQTMPEIETTYETEAR